MVSPRTCTCNRLQSGLPWNKQTGSNPISNAKLSGPKYSKFPITTCRCKSVAVSLRPNLHNKPPPIPKTAALNAGTRPSRYSASVGTSGLGFQHTRRLSEAPCQVHSQHSWTSYAPLKSTASMAGCSLAAGIAMGRTSPHVFLGTLNPLACHLCGVQHTCLIKAIAILALI